MNEFIKAIGKFLSRDLMYVIGGTSFLLSAAFALGFEFKAIESITQNNVITLLLLGIAYVSGYINQEALSLSPIITTNQIKNPNIFLKWLYKKFTNSDFQEQNDIEYTSEKIKLLKNYAGGEIPILAVSALTGEGLENLGLELLRALHIIRVYTKEPNKKDSAGEPFILKVGSSIGDLARNIHSYLYTNYKYARIWGPSSKFPGEKVGINHILADQDIVEIHAR